jgi:F-box and leucine-rich repeat protein 10/11
LSNPEKISKGSPELIGKEIDIPLQAKRRFNMEKKLLSNDYSISSVVRSMCGKDFNVSNMQKEGFENPVLVLDKSSLELKMPGQKMFGVADIRAAVGSRRCVDVVDSDNQKSFSMTLKDWHRYFEGHDRSSILSTMGLEISNTKLDSQIGRPRIVRQIDWIDKAWPRHFKQLQVEPTNNADDMMYPKVSK